VRVIVIGSGIAGLTAVIALRKVGIDVTVYERAPELREVGAGISLWANAIRALDHLGVGDAIRAVSLSLDRSEMRASDLRARNSVIPPHRQRSSLTIKWTGFE
jgi:2-polyprenyl-6-methoxyphenol hydroxylase-like FAD-dependent oxidoreductase